MTDTLKGALIGATAAVLAAILAAWLGFRQLDAGRQQLRSERDAAEQERQKLTAELERHRKAQESGPGAFVARVASLIEHGVAAPAGEESTARQARLETDARAIVKARNDLRTALDGLAQRLDPEIDALAREVGRSQPSADRLSTSLQTLQRSWATRAPELMEAVRRLIAELGLVGSTS
jgi:DNA repair exonuclease SbcCD ATPase subunit